MASRRPQTQVLQPGAARTPIATIVKRLGDPDDDSGGIFDFGVIRFAVRDGVVERIILPAID